MLTWDGEVYVNYAIMILKWVLWMALLRSMNYEKPKEGPRRKIPPKIPKPLNYFSIKIVHDLQLI